MTGISVEEAKGYLEMCGGDVSKALNLCNDLGPDGGGSDNAVSPPNNGEWSEVHEVVFGKGPVPESWLCQGCEIFCEKAVVYKQEKNGPCGALAALNGLVQLEIIERPSSTAEEALMRAIGWLLFRCAVVKEKLISGARCDAHVNFTIFTAFWKADGIYMENGNYTSALNWLRSPQLTKISHAISKRGGLALLLYSAVATRGAARIRAETSDGLPLVTAPHAFCGPELLDLLLSGAARGDFFVSKDQIIKNAEEKYAVTSTLFRARGTIGFLSHDESTGRIVCDELKRPLRPIFILHGGDHFTLLFKNYEQNFWYHWNGLEPNRKLSLLRLSNSCQLDDPSPPPSARYKVRPGEIESIVQRSSTKLWYRDISYELSLVTPEFAHDDPTPSRPQSNNLPSSLNTAPPDIFDFGPQPNELPWRCLKCYHSRFQTASFGLNHSLLKCAVCGTGLRDDKGNPNWSIWCAYKDLPKSTQRRVDRSYAPKLLSVLRTRWIDVEVDVSTIVSSSSSSKSKDDKKTSSNNDDDDNNYCWRPIGHPDISASCAPVL
eukprot:CAMPEP_0197309028 /NCGR_PEP_ID=MMETSP0891-20130614/7574_1 /TAXON_ID=44058 ORGANISM="Aureoumbra lagunensis, Strain CCMP1510" /NCGR_SAMPLE_ID=MMETSP0891 /ASSEMBLY_ACC=CAM_ASM_000534 /LENGTH=546 /DNA_ID=CAMNT_0042793877 /DNA_START=131 /DNA_END=1771 /DNA_ORIENTATION=+